MTAESLPPLPEPPAPPPKSVLVTLLAWSVIVLSGLLLPISLISALMVAVGSPGTSNSDPLGYLTVVVAPVVAFASGIGLLFRKAWARYALLALLTMVMLSTGYEMVRAPTETRTYFSPEGVKTTVLGSGPGTFSPIFAIALGLVVALLLPRVRREFETAGRHKEV